jgi:hypothetical protein
LLQFMFDVQRLSSSRWRPSVGCFSLSVAHCFVFEIGIVLVLAAPSAVNRLCRSCFLRTVSLGFVCPPGPHPALCLLHGVAGRRFFPSQSRSELSAALMLCDTRSSLADVIASVHECRDSFHVTPLRHYGVKLILWRRLSQARLSSFPGGAICLLVNGNDRSQLRIGSQRGASSLLVFSFSLSELVRLGCFLSRPPRKRAR